MLKKNSIKNYLYSLAGLPIPKKTRKSTTRRRLQKKNYMSYYSNRAVSLPRKRRLTKEQQGSQIAKASLSLYKSSTNNAPGYVGDTRVHYGEIGFVACVLGSLSNDKVLMGFGKELMLDDIADVHEWFTFKRRESLYYGSTNYNLGNYNPTNYTVY